MQTIDDILDTILKHEGGFVDDPNDPGGATKHGISLRYARGIGLDNDGDGDVDADDIRLVTPDQARQLYLEDFYLAPGLDRLPATLQAHMFDFSVNSGPARAVMTLQQVVNEIVLGEPLIVDGRMGPKTRRAVEQAAAQVGVLELNDRVCRARIEFMYALAAANPRYRGYVVSKSGGKGGWIVRVESFLTKGVTQTLSNRVLRRGDTGEEVAELQLTLNRRMQIPVGRIFDGATERMVRAFQYAHGLTPDGLVGPATRKALQS